jgi:ABC-type polar amino acid transport system ATPase subunit
MLQVDGLKKSFHRNEVLKGISMTVNPGEVVGIIDSSGSGKSSLLRCLNLLEIPDAGYFSFCNLAKVKKHEIMEIRRSTAMVFQQFNLFKYKTALENVMEGPLVVQKKNKIDAKEQAEYYLAKVGLSDRITTIPPSFQADNSSVLPLPAQWR